LFGRNELQLDKGDKMKRVLLISQNFYPEIGSHANRIKNIYLELRKLGYNVKVLTTEPSYPNRNIYNDSTFWNEEIVESDVIRIKTKSRRYTRNMFNRLFLYLEFLFKLIGTILGLKRDFDFIFVTSPPIFVGLAGIFAKWKLKAPLIVDVRDLWPESLLGVGVFTNKAILNIAYTIERKLYHAADKMVVNSEGFIPYIENKGIAKENIFFIPNSLTEVELQTSALKEHEKEENITVIYTGNVGLAQDVQTLIDLAERFKPNEKVHFKIIGYGIKRQRILQLIKDKRLHNIELIQVKSRKETLLEVSKSDIAYVGLINKEVFETVLPGKIIDYMCMRKPIIGNLNGYSKQVIQDAGCGFVSDDHEIDELSKSMEMLINNPHLRKKLGNNGYEYAKVNLRWKNNVKTLLKVLN
jgi:glycosyltransferase involved in cell wall biosynthesis